MTFNSKLLSFIYKITGWKIIKQLPRGMDLFFDLKQHLSNYSPHIIFDVGANVGQSTKEYIEHFPSANVYAFEPITNSFEILITSTNRYKNVSCYQLAFGKIEEDGYMIAEDTSTGNCIIQKDSLQNSNIENKIEKVRILTIDSFCKEKKIDHISFLKIDTEGNDLNVLKGAEETLLNKRVQVVQVEAGLDPSNTLHVPLCQFINYLEPLGYIVFGIYDQTEEFFRHEPQLRRVNAVFISSK